MMKVEGGVKRRGAILVECVHVGAALYEGLAQRVVAHVRRDVEHGLTITLDYFRTREQQEHALNILQFMCGIATLVNEYASYEDEYVLSE